MFKIQWVDDYFEARSLKRQLRIADDQAELMRNEIAAHKASIKDQQATINQLRQDKQHFENKIEELKGEIREQTAADLLVNALIGLGVVPKPKAKYDPFAEQQRLQNLQAMANTHGNPQRSAALGGLGQAFGL